MGQHASDTAQILFDNCRVPAANLLGEEGAGLKIALSGWKAGASASPAQAVGMARAAFDAALAYSKERVELRHSRSSTTRRCSSSSPTWPRRSRPRAS